MGHKERGGYIGGESIFPSFLNVLGGSVAKGGKGGKGDRKAEETQRLSSFNSTASWSTVVCDGPGELLLISPALLRVVGIAMHKQVVGEIAKAALKRPLDHVVSIHFVCGGDCFLY